MQLLFAIITPWILFFVTAIFAVMMLVSAAPKMPVPMEHVIKGLLIAGTLLCLLANSTSIRKAGIWLSDALPEQLRYGSGRWIFLALKSAAIAGVIFAIGALPWTPLIWQGVILPVGVSVCLFFFIWFLYGSILRWSINFPWSRAVAMVVSLPLMLLVPITANHMQKKILFAYRASQADPAIAFEGAVEKQATAAAPVVAPTAKDTKTDAKAAAVDPKLTAEKTISLLSSSKSADRALAFRSLTFLKSLCAERGKDVTKALDPRGDAQVVLWAVKAAKCADLKPPIALPRFVAIMNEHKDPETRAAAIRALRYYGNEQASLLAYLLVKRLSENEPAEVITATAEVLAAMGPDQQRWSGNRLKVLLDSDKTSQVAAHALMNFYKRPDLVGEYVKTHLPEEGTSRQRAISMICELPPETRTMAEPHIAKIVATVKTGDDNDPSLTALRCMGPAGVKAIREELRTPRQLERRIAAHAFAEIDVVDSAPETLEIASDCVRDSDQEVRKWCSQSLGNLGAAALPKIMELLNSSDSELKSSGQNALAHLDDPAAAGDLEKVLRANTGWMATPHKLQLAKLVGSTLNRLKKTE